MAMTSGGSSGSRSYSYTVTKSYSVEEAIDMAGRGELDPITIYSQLPQPLKEEVDRIAFQLFLHKKPPLPEYNSPGKFFIEPDPMEPDQKEEFESIEYQRGGTFGNAPQNYPIKTYRHFTNLDLSEKRAVMQDLSAEIKRAKEQREKPLTIREALQMAKKGSVDSLKLFQALPPELQKAMDAIAQNQSAKDFCSANLETRNNSLQLLLELLDEAAEEDARKQEAEEEAKRREQEQAKLHAEEEARQLAKKEAMRLEQEKAKQKAEVESRQRAEKEAMLRKTIEAERRNFKQCVLCGAPLGFINRFLKREQHPDCIE
jgi:hypothetical protein